MICTVLYGRKPKKEDCSGRDVVWCNVDSDPNEIRAWGAKQVFAYVNGGAIEDWAEGAKVFKKRNPKLIGRAYEGWPGEYWLDVRHPETQVWIEKQVNRVKQAGFNGVDFDNLNGNEHKTGFGLKQSDLVTHCTRLVNMAKKLGLKCSFRHVSEPTKVPAPTYWLVEDVIRDNAAGRYPAGITVSLEYSEVKNPVPAGMTVVRADKALTKNWGSGRQSTNKELEMKFCVLGSTILIIVGFLLAVIDWRLYTFLVSAALIGANMLLLLPSRAIESNRQLTTRSTRSTRSKYCEDNYISHVLPDPEGWLGVLPSQTETQEQPNSPDKPFSSGDAEYEAYLEAARMASMSEYKRRMEEGYKEHPFIR